MEAGASPDFNSRKQTRKDSDDVAKSAEATDSGSQKLPVLEAASGAGDW